MAEDAVEDAVTEALQRVVQLVASSVAEITEKHPDLAAGAPPDALRRAVLLVVGQMAEAGWRHIPSYGVTLRAKCDHCGTERPVDPAEAIRSRAREEHGWSCTEDGDFCPPCITDLNGP